MAVVLLPYIYLSVYEFQFCNNREVGGLRFGENANKFWEKVAEQLLRET